MATVSSTSNYFPTAQEGFSTATSGTTASGATTVGLNSVSGYANGEVVTLVIDPTDSTKKQVFTGVVDTSGIQITGVVWTEGTNQTHSSGATVVDYETATAWALQAKGLLVEHSQSGIHKLTQLVDTNSNEFLKLSQVASAVNEITIANAATGNAPSISATGGDTNINLALTGKGTGGVLPKIPYKFSAYQSADLAITNGVWTKVPLDTELFDTSSNFDSATNYRFTAPVTGFYLIVGQVTLSTSGYTSGASAQAAIYKNGSAVRYSGVSSGSGSASAIPHAVMTDLFSLSSGDYIELYGLVNDTGRHLGSGSTNTFMSGYLVST